MTTLPPAVTWLQSQHAQMRRYLIQWANINSSTFNHAGVQHFSQHVLRAFNALHGKVERIKLQPLQRINTDGKWEHHALGDLIRITKRPKAPIQVLLSGHLDTVFPANHPFQTVTTIDNNRLNGPGVTDMKGGLLVMLYALLALERSPHAKNIGWEICLTPDEEIGSPHSSAIVTANADHYHFGLIFEPAMTPEGALAGRRKGSGKFTLVTRGKTAHAGRSFHKGRNAIYAMSDLIQGINRLNNKRPGLTLNIGTITGGTAINVVPDLCHCQLDIRLQNADDIPWLTQKLHRLIEKVDAKPGFKAELHGGFYRPPKPLRGQTRRLIELIRETGSTLDIDIHWKSSGGCCDGNNLAAAGLPVVDSLGVRGGFIHSDREYIIVDSLVERAQLSALLLHRFASGEYSLE